VEVPVNLTREQRDALEQFDSSLQEGGKRHSPQSRSYIDGVKSFFHRF
jgi:molecular chaperone DnaJ